MHAKGIIISFNEHVYTIISCFELQKKKKKEKQERERIIIESLLTKA
jgi:hypothetical protein